MTKLESIFSCIVHLENLKKQATVEHSHFYVNSIASEAIRLLYDFAATFAQKEPK